MQPRQKFKKEERLCSTKLIGELFSNGQSFFEYPFKVIFKLQDENTPEFNKFPAKVLFTVPKRRFKLAVDRNKLKRLLRESYRKDKHELYNYLVSNKTCLSLAFIYTGKKILDYHEIEKRIKGAMLRLIQDIEKAKV